MTVELVSPPALEHGFVRGRFVKAIADSLSDNDRLPDLRGISGSVKFTPLAPIRLVSGEAPATVVKEAITVPLNDQGYLVDAQSSSDGNQPGAWFAVGRYQVDTLFPIASRVPSFSIEVGPEHDLANPLDLALHAPLILPPGTTEVTRLVDRQLAERAALTASTSATQAATVKAELEAIFAGGTEAINDAAVNTYMRTDGAATRGTLLGAVETPTTGINLMEASGDAAPKILRVRSSSIPGTGVGAEAGRSAVFEVGDSRAKSMIDYRFPLKSDGTIWDFKDGTPPENAYKSVAWFGVCHYWAQDQADHENPTDLHNHISILEMPDSNLDLHTIFDSPIGSTDDPTAIGADSHRIRTNRSDFVVRVGNPFDPTLGRAYRLKVSASPDYEKMISFHSSTSGETTGNNMSGVRWEIGVLPGADGDFTIRRYLNSGFVSERPFMVAERASGRVTFGKNEHGPGRVNVLTSENDQDLFYGYPESGVGDGTLAVFAARVGSVTNKVFRALTGSSNPGERFHILGDGKLEWGNSSTIDTNLYRSGASTLATDDDFDITLSSRGLIQRSPNGTRWRVSINNDGTMTTTAL